VTDEVGVTKVTDGVSKYSLNNIYDAGWKSIKEMDIKSVRKRAKRRRRRKRRVAKYVLNKVVGYRNNSGSLEGMDMLEPEWSCEYKDAWWTDCVQGMCLSRYQ